MNTLKKILSLVLTTVLVVGMLPITMSASAEGTVYNLAELLNNSVIKPLGRTAVNPDNTGIMCDWPGNGFQMNVSGGGGTLEVTVVTDYEANWAVLVDDTQVYWERLPETGGTISAAIPSGDHLVSVIKESDNKGKESNYCDLITMTFPGTIQAKPADKALTIEFIGDSYTCGHGTLGTYAPGYQWVGTEHSFTHGFAYYTAQNLNADYMIAARGGIGLFDGVSAEQPDDDPDATIADIYPYTAGFRKSAGLYDFAKQVDIVVVELGANDTISESDANFKSAAWKARLESLTNTVREKYPDASIVFLSHRAAKYKIMKTICEERAESDPNLYAFSFAHQGNGSGTATQYYGHPNAADSKELADALSAFLVERGLTPKTEETEPTYTDYHYYASVSGNDSNDGTTLSTAKLTLTGALAQARADRTYAAGERIVVNVEGTININPSSNQYLADVGQILLPDGTEVPILVQTNEYSGTKAVLDTNHQPSDANSCMVWFCNSMTLKDITFQSTTYEAEGTRDFQLYAGYNHIVFDNVTFAVAGAAPTESNVKSSWYVSAAHAVAAVDIPDDGQSVITFQNGNYTNISAMTVYRGNLYKNDGNITNAPSVHARIIIEDGAQMKNLYNRWGELGLGSTTVEIRGGSVTNYHGTVNSDSASYSNFIGNVNFVMSGGTVSSFIGTRAGTSSRHKTFEGDINFTMSGGTIDSTGFQILNNYADVTGNVNVNISGGDILSDQFNTVGKYCTVSGAVTNTISGGIIEIRPTKDYQAINFGAQQNGTLGSVTNNISGGMFFIVFDTAKINSGYYFGSESSTTIQGTVTNNISGGSFVPMNGAAKANHSAIYFGTMSGSILGGLYNNITGGTFDVSAASESGIRLGSYSPNVPCPKIANVIGDKNSQKGPMFLGSDVYMGGLSGSVGVTTAPTAMPEVSQCSDQMVISNTFYNGFIDKALYCGPYEAEADGEYRFVLGSIENNFYGGSCKGTFYGAGSADIYGKVTTNLYGGHIGNIYAGGNAATVYDGVELNIYGGFEEYHNVSKNNSWYFRGGTYGADIPAPQTAGRDAIKVTIASENPTDLTLYTPVTAACRSTYKVDGKVSVTVSGGIFPEGLSISNRPVNSLLAEGYVVVDTASGTLLEYDDTEVSTGETSVTVMKREDVKEPLIPENYIATVVNGKITSYPTTVEEMRAAVSSTGNSVITLRSDISYDSAIVLPYSCTLDLNGYTIRTNPTSGNGIKIDAVGSQNAVTTVKNGTIYHYVLGICVSAGAIIVDNMNIISASGAPIGIYDINPEYKSVNKITGSFLSSNSYYCIAFNKPSVDFTGTGITVSDSVLVSHKSGSGSSIIGTKGTGGTVTLGKDVKLYSYSSNPANGTTAFDGEATTKIANQSVVVNGTEYTGMNMWATAESQYIAVDSTTGNRYETIAEATMAMAENGGTLRLTKDINEPYVSVWGGITIDLNGHNLETKYFTCFGDVVDTGAGGYGLLKVTADIHISGDDSYLPLYDTVAEGYRFYRFALEDLGTKPVEGSPNAIKFGFRLVLDNFEGYSVLANTGDAYLDMRCALNWTGFENGMSYGFADATLKAYAAAVAADFASQGYTKKALTLTVRGLQVLSCGDYVRMTPSLNTLPGITARGTECVWQVS